MPTALVLARPDISGGLRLAGATRPLPPSLAAQIAELLEPVDVDPQRLPAGRLGVLGGMNNQQVTVHQVQPKLVVEVLADTAWEHGRWRHRVPLVRLRPDLTPPISCTANPEARAAPRLRRLRLGGERVPVGSCMGRGAELVPGGHSQPHRCTPCRVHR